MKSAIEEKQRTPVPSIHDDAFVDWMDEQMLKTGGDKIKAIFNIPKATFVKALDAFTQIGPAKESKEGVMPNFKKGIMPPKPNETTDIVRWYGDYTAFLMVFEHIYEYIEETKQKKEAVFNKLESSKSTYIIDLILEKFDEAGATETATDQTYNVVVTLAKTPITDADIDELITKLTTVKKGKSVSAKLTDLRGKATDVASTVKQKLGSFFRGGVVTEDLIAKLETLKDKGSVTFEGDWSLMDKYRERLLEVRSM